MANLGLTDAPVSSYTEEALGVSEYVNALSKFVSACQTPMTISIQGDWGSGKTSMMNLVKEKLISNSNNKVETLWFNTWQFSQFDMQDELPISLLTYFSKQLGEQGKDVLLKVLKSKVVPMLGKGAKVFTDIFTGGGGDAIQEMISKLANSDLDISMQVQELKESIKNGVKLRLEKSKSDRMVIFVDDLDRLLPDKAVELLEVIKLFLDVENCVFVLAIDYAVVAKGLEKKFGVSMKDIKGKSFFDKIIQLPFNLPIAQYDTKKYFEGLLKDFEYNSKDIDLYIRLANLSIGFNPRSMKRLFNSLQLLNMVAESKNILGTDEISTVKEKQLILFGVLCAQTAFEDFYRYLLKNLGESKSDDDNALSEFFLLLKNKSQMNNEANTDLRKLLNINEEEILNKFTGFMEAFYEAIQLESDTSENESETLSPGEIKTFKKLISFSSLTTSNVSNLNINAECGFKYDLIANRILEELNIKYKVILQKLEIKLITQQRENGFLIFLKDITIGPLSFSLCAYFYNTNCGVEFWDWETVTPDGKYVTGEWAKKHLSQHYKIQPYNRKTYGYIELWTKKHEKNELEKNEELLIKNFKDQVISTFDIVLSKLENFYDTKIDTIQKIKSFVVNVTDRIKNEFKSEDGWIVECTATKLGRWGKISVCHADWSQKIKIEMQGEQNNFNNLFYCLSRGTWDLKFKEGREEILRTAMNEFAPTSHDGWRIAQSFFNEPARNIVNNDFLGDNFKYLLDTPEKENEVIGIILDKFQKMKSLKLKIDETIKD